MYIETVANRNSPPCILLRESYRESGKVKKRTLANLTTWSTAAVDQLRLAISGKACAEFEIERSLPHGHVAAVRSVMQSLKLPALLGGHDCRERQLAIALIIQRILEPGSKLASARRLTEQTATSSLGVELGLGTVSEVELYAAMDWLLERQDEIEKKLARRHLAENGRVLYDLTSTYMEGTKCPLSKLGYSRDGKKDKLQVEFGLLCDEGGRPVSVQVYAGNVADQATVAEQVDTLRNKFGLSRVIVVGDRGMLTDARINEDLKPHAGLDWISALTTPAIRKLQEAGLIQPELFDLTDLGEITSPDFPDERLVVCKNPALAERRRIKRESLLAATECELEKIKSAVRREKRPLRGAAAIGVRVGKVINCRKVAKHFLTTITDDDFHYERNTAKISEEAALDGIYVVRSSLGPEAGTAAQLVKDYKQLSTVENAFRSIKTIDLHVRPVYHYTADRVRAHIFLCMLAYYVEWHMMQKIAPLLFKDEFPEQGAAKRKSVVAQAQVSDHAIKKGVNLVNDDGLPIHSFRTLLADLATLTRNHIRFGVRDTALVVRYTLPTPTQKKAFDLLGVPAM